MIMESDSFKKVLKHKVWNKAMKEKIRMIKNNETRELAILPPKEDVIGVKWVYKTKLNFDCSFQNYKAQLVAKEY